MVALRAIVFVVFFMGTVLVYVPYLLVSGSAGAAPLDLGTWRYAGLVPLALGIMTVAWCVRDFTVVGRGTPAPFDPPRALVATPESGEEAPRAEIRFLHDVLRIVLVVHEVPCERVRVVHQWDEAPLESLQQAVRHSSLGPN